MRGVLWISVSVLAVLSAAHVHAEDPAASPRSPEPVAGSWTGLHLGSRVGVGLVDTHWGAGTGVMAAPDARAYAAVGSASTAVSSVQIGYDRQFGSQVFGVEGTLGTGFLYSRARCLRDGVYVCSADTGLLGTLSARAGYAFDDLLVYGKVGAAFADGRYTATGLYQTGRFTGSRFGVGRAFGAGVEMALTPRMSIAAEYAFLDFDTADVTLRNGGTRTSVPISTSAQTIGIGLNWRPWDPTLPSAGFDGVVSAHDWSGFHVGVHAGGAWGRDSWKSGTGPLATAAAGGSFPGESDPMGLLGGGQFGFDHQTGAWVIGAEVSASAADLDGWGKCMTDNTGSSSSWACRNTVKSIGSVSGRLGRSEGDLLVYGRAGAAWATGSSQMAMPLAATDYTSRGTRWGWMLGSGLEYALSPSLSAFVEYDHYDFGTRTQTYSGAGGSATARFDERFDLVRMGVNHHFGTEGRNPPSAATAPALPAGWTAEIGARYFADSGRMQKDLKDPVETDRLNSRLIYADTNGRSLETFFRFEHRDGLFLKGHAGLGSLVGGRLNDEDFPGAVDYSNTITQIRTGHLSSVAIDLGHELIRRDGDTLGAFVGYRSLHQNVNGFGCRQVATDEICDANQVAWYPALRNGIGLSQTETWKAVALGLNSRSHLTERLRLEVDAAYLPYATHTSIDNHWWRADINPLVERGQGWGAQMEAVLDYAVTDRFSVGLGARYWYFATDSAATQFYGIPLRSPQVFYSERWGAFLQGSYRFGDLPGSRAGGENRPIEAKAAPVDWTGLRVGGGFGAGKGHTGYASPFPRPVSGDAAELGGATARLRIGGDYQTGALVLGAEVSAGWANVLGTDTCFSTSGIGSLAGFDCGSRVGALGTVTGRLGWAFDRTLLYARGGWAWDRQKDTFNDHNFGGRIIEHDSGNTGWVIGGGLEYALTSNLSVGLEYEHFDFGGSSAFTTDSLTEFRGVNLAPRDLRLDMVGMTLAYRFTGAAGAP
jgi:opacity protein-like surface antigen